MGARAEPHNIIIISHIVTHATKYIEYSYLVPLELYTYYQDGILYPIPYQVYTWYSKSLSACMLFAPVLAKVPLTSEYLVT